jgi:hypothetical protein
MEEDPPRWWLCSAGLRWSCAVSAVGPRVLALSRKRYAGRTPWVEVEGGCRIEKAVSGCMCGCEGCHTGGAGP